MYVSELEFRPSPFDPSPAALRPTLASLSSTSDTMPKELVRKRGKRKPKSDPTPAAPVAEAPASTPVLEAIDGRDSGYGQRTARLQQQQDAGGEGDQPSWVTPADGGMGSIRERVEGDAPWGFVDPEVPSPPLALVVQSSRTADHIGMV